MKITILRYPNKRISLKTLANLTVMTASHVCFPGADTGGCTSCTEDRGIFRSKFLTVSFSVFLKNLVRDSLSNFLLSSQASTRNQCPKFPVDEPCRYVSAP